MGRGGHRLPLAAVGHGQPRCPTTSALARDDVLALLAVDRSHPASIACSLDAARENARRAREVVSTELWEALNTHERADAAQGRRATRCTSSSRWVRERVARSPSASSSRRRAATRRGSFFMLGRAIERADMTARLLAHPVARPRRAARLDHDPARVRRVRGVPAHATAACRARADGGRVPAARPAVPARRSSLASPRRAVAARDRAARRPRRRDDQAQRLLGQIRSRAGVPAGRRDARRPAAAHGARAGGDVARRARRSGSRYFPASAAPSWVGEAREPAAACVHTHSASTTTAT